MAGSKGGGGGGKGGSVTPVGGGYGGGYGTGYYNPQPRLPQAPYNPMMDMYGSSRNVMQPMMGYYNQFPLPGQNYQPYQPQPQPDPPVYEPTPMPDPTPNPGPGNPGGPFNQQGVPENFAGNPFNDVYHGSNSFAADPSFYENHNIQYTAPATATGNYNFSTNPQSNNFTPLNSFVANAPTPFLPDVMTAAIPYNQSVPTNNTVDMPILDAADKTGGKRGNTYGIKHSGPAVQNLTPDDNPGFGGYDQNARSIMFTAPTFNFGGYF